MWCGYFGMVLLLGTCAGNSTPAAREYRKRFLNKRYHNTSIFPTLEVRSKETTQLVRGSRNHTSHARSTIALQTEEHVRISREMGLPIWRCNGSVRTTKFEIIFVFLPEKVLLITIIIIGGVKRITTWCR